MRRGLVVLTVLCLLAMCPVTWAKGSYDGEIAKGVRLRLMHEVDQWGECTVAGVRFNESESAARQVEALIAAGGFKFHEEVRSTPGDWVIGCVILEDGAEFKLDQLALVYHIDDGTELVILSDEVLLTDSGMEKEVFRTPVLLPSDLYTRTHGSGGYLIAVRFTEGSLPPARRIFFIFGADWGYQKPDSVVPKGGDAE